MLESCVRPVDVRLSPLAVWTGFMLSIQTEVSCGRQNPHLSPAKSLFELDAKVCSFLAAPWKAQVIPVFLQD